MKHFIYDEDLQAVRYEIRNFRPGDETTFNSTDPYLFIHDYNVGVSYGFNKKTRECTIKSLGSAFVQHSFDTNINFDDSYDGIAVKLKSPESLLMLDSTYIYVGKRLVNNVNSNVYMSNRSVGSINNPAFVITEFAFSDEIAFFDTFKNETQIPVGINIINNIDNVIK